MLNSKVNTSNFQLRNVLDKCEMYEYTYMYKTNACGQFIANNSEQNNRLAGCSIIMIVYT